MPPRAPIPQPSGPHYVFATLAGAQAAQAAVDAATGYPKAGVFAAPGPFQPPTPFVTTTYNDVLVHPSGTQWAYPSDPTADAALAGQGLSAAALTPDWSGAAIVAHSVAASLAAQRRPSVRALVGLAAVGAVGIIAAAALQPSTTPATVPLDAEAVDAGEDGAE